MWDSVFICNGIFSAAGPCVPIFCSPFYWLNHWHTSRNKILSVLHVIDKDTTNVIEILYRFKTFHVFNKSLYQFSSKRYLLNE